MEVIEKYLHMEILWKVRWNRSVRSTRNLVNIKVGNVPKYKM